MGTLRTEATEARYQADIKAGRTQPLSEVKSLAEWKHWRLIPNEYPHDLVCIEHDLLVPKRIFSEPLKMELEEQMELLSILFNDLKNQYDTIKINYPRQQSVLNHWHLHLVRNK
jgi:diadenosine tetraphosphate (Ap4A) HIT family hydrolase